MVTVPEGAVAYDAAKLKTLLNLKTDDEGQRVLDLAVVEVGRAFDGAFRDVPQVVFDDCVRRVAGAIVGSTKRPSSPAGAGQLTTVAAQQPVAGSSDYTATIRQLVAQYVAPL